MSTATGHAKNDRDDKIRNAADAVADRAAELANKAGYQVDRALDSAEGIARSVAEQGRR